MTEQELSNKISSLYEEIRDLEKTKSDLQRERLKRELNEKLYSLAENKSHAALMLYREDKSPFLFIGELSLDEGGIWLEGVTFEKNPEISNVWMRFNEYFSEDASNFKSIIIQDDNSYWVSTVEESLRRVNNTISKFKNNK